MLNEKQQHLLFEMRFGDIVGQAIENSKAKGMKINEKVVSDLANAFRVAVSVHPGPVKTAEVIVAISFYLSHILEETSVIRRVKKDES